MSILGFRGALAASILALCGVDSVAAASFSINPYGALLERARFSGGSFGNAGIILPETPIFPSSFAFAFVLPRDYRRNTPVRIVLSWHTPDVSCGIYFLPNFVDRTRERHPPSSGLANAGLSPVGSDLLLAPDEPNEGNRKTYILAADQGFNQQISGDAILLGFFRLPDEPEDTVLLPI